MSHSYTQLLYHIIFATKGRRPDLDAAVRPGLFAYLGGLVRAERGIALAVNGVADHVHLLAPLRPDRPLADVLRAAKAHSSRWLREHAAAGAAFACQTGHGAFTVSLSQAPTVQAYIRDQEARHQRSPSRTKTHAYSGRTGSRCVRRRRRGEGRRAGAPGCCRPGSSPRVVSPGGNSGRHAALPDRV